MNEGKNMVGSGRKTRMYGYARVSSTDQNEDRQLIALLEQGVEPGCIFVDKQSGRDFERPAYQRMLRELEPGDLLYVKSIDRLGRNYEEIQNQWRVLTREKQADICVIEMPLLDTRRGKDLMGTFLSDIVLQVLSFVAENERMTIRQRQAEGIAAARIRGVRFGRVPLAPPDNFEEIVRAWKAHEISIGTALKRSRMSRSTFFRKRRELGMLETPEAGGVWKGDS